MARPKRRGRTYALATARADLPSPTPLLLVTATDIETEALHAALSPLPNCRKILKLCADNQTYFLAKLGPYAVAHVQTAMGSVGRDSAITTITEAIDYIGPAAIVMVGIAFGIDSKKQRIGDVLVSETVIPYEHQRVGRSVVPRGPAPPAGKQLLNRFRNTSAWHFPLSSKSAARVVVGPVLSGEKLIDNAQFRNRLLRRHPTAIGGEMEGAGLYAAAATKNAAWILVKGIADFADGKKRHQKHKRQTLAARAAVDLCQQVFSDPNAIPSATTPATPEPAQRIDAPADLVLFDIYTKICEPYYVPRDLDDIVTRSLSLSHLWLFGPSGTGKTTTIRRELLSRSDRILYICLASYSSATHQAILNGFVFELADSLQQPLEDYAPDRPRHLAVKHAVRLLRVAPTITTASILIEEIPSIPQEELLKLLDALLEILTAADSESSGLRSHLAISTIARPPLESASNRQKFESSFFVLQASDWTEIDSARLLSTLLKHLHLKLTAAQQASIVSTSNGSPRFIKQFLRRYLTLGPVASSQFDTFLRIFASDFA